MSSRFHFPKATGRKPGGPFAAVVLSVSVALADDEADPRGA